MLLPCEAAVAGDAQGVNCMCHLDVSAFLSGTSRLRSTDGGELQRSEWEPERRPSHPGPQRDQRALLPGLRWRRPHRGRSEGLAQTVHQAGRHLNSCAALDASTHMRLVVRQSSVRKLLCNTKADVSVRF